MSKQFTAEAEKRGLRFKIDGFNLFIEPFRSICSMMIPDFDGNEIYIVFERGYLAVQHRNYDVEEYLW